MTKKVFYGLLVLLVIQLPVAFARQGNLSSQDQKFFKDAAAGSLMEIELGKIAAERADNPEVKQFADRMVQDHTQASQQLQQIAQQKGLEVPQTLDKKHRKKIDDLSKKSGADFERQYMKEMVKDHQKDVSEFQKQAKSGKDQELQKFASNSLPTLQHHQQEAKQINQKLGSRGSSENGSTRRSTERSSTRRSTEGGTK